MIDSERDALRRERLVKNEMAFRDYNDRRVAFELQAGDDELVPWVCECGDANCIQALQATVEEFQAAHSGPDRFFVKPHHFYSDVERLVHEHDRYWVVEKHAGEMRRAT